MPTHQVIIDENDRDFHDDIGNWTGDAVWQYSDTSLTNGVATLTLNPDETEKEMILSYPHIRPQPGYQHRLTIKSNTKNPGEDLTLTWTLTDGTHTYAGDNLITWSLTPTDIDELMDVDTAFDTESAVLTITATKEVTILDAALYTDFYSLIWETTAKPDHLPLMGVH